MTLSNKLRTLLILLAVLPPLLWIGWGKYQAWKAERDRQRILRALTRKTLRSCHPNDRPIALAFAS